MAFSSLIQRSSDLQPKCQWEAVTGTSVAGLDSRTHITERMGEKGAVHPPFLTGKKKRTCFSIPVFYPLFVFSFFTDMILLLVLYSVGETGLWTRVSYGSITHSDPDASLCEDPLKDQNTFITDSKSVRSDCKHRQFWFTLILFFLSACFLIRDPGRGRRGKRDRVIKRAKRRES